jgi:hypothetical protein
VYSPLKIPKNILRMDIEDSAKENILKKGFIKTRAY